MVFDAFGSAEKVKAERGKTEKKVRSTSTAPTSFRLDRAVVRDFKSACAQRGESMTSVLERMMLEYIG